MSDQSEATRSWQGMRGQWARLLEDRTGHDVDAWNRQVREGGFDDEAALRAWLTEQGVTGNAQMLLVIERFEYPDYLVAGADELSTAGTGTGRSFVRSWTRSWPWRRPWARSPCRPARPM